jgi:glycerol-3-phosphate dehydrogenase
MNEEERKEAIEKDPRYAIMVCRCELVTEGDVVNAINRPIRAITVDMVKRRTRAGMGRCQGGFCSPTVMKLIAEERGIGKEQVTKNGGGSYIVTEKL